jgi:hypothetical protein
VAAKRKPPNLALAEDALRWAAAEVHDALSEERPFHRMAKLACAAEQIGHALAIVGKAMLVHNFENAPKE